MREIHPIETPDSVVVAPGSKSLTNRGLVIGALAGGETLLEGALLCEDTVRLLDALRALGFLVREEAGRGVLRIHGEGGRIPAHRARLDVGASGTAMRFLVALASIGPGEYEVDGDRGLRERPVRPLCEALAALGGRVETAPGGGAPVRVRPAEVMGGAVSLKGGISSQFASALLLVAPYLPWGLRLQLTGDVVSAPYLDLTVGIMRDFGARIERRDERNFVVEPSAYRARSYRIEGDATAASYFFAAAAVTGGRVRVGNLPRGSRQGDLVALELLESMGAKTARGPDWAEVRGGPLHGIDVNLRDAPDLVPTLAAVGMAARGRTRIRGVPHLRVKESDRIEAILRAVRALGGTAEAFADGFTVEGGEVRPGSVDPMGDHRIAMAFAVLGLMRPGIRILTPDVVGKSYPDFFARLSAL